MLLGPNATFFFTRVVAMWGQCINPYAHDIPIFFLGFVILLCENWYFIVFSFLWLLIKQHLKNRTIITYLTSLNFWQKPFRLELSPLHWYGNRFKAVRISSQIHRTNRKTKIFMWCLKNYKCMLISNSSKKPLQLVQKFHIKNLNKKYLNNESNLSHFKMFWPSMID